VTQLLWFRGKDLRLSDHAPLRAALEFGQVVPVFVLDPFFFAPTRARELPHRMQFLLESLTALASNLAHLGSRLLIVEGKSHEQIPKLARELNATRVLAHRWTEPFGRERDAKVQAAMACPLVLFEGETLHPPGGLRNGQGTPYAVFTPFARAFAQRVEVDKPLAAPRALPALPSTCDAVATVPIPTLAELGIAHNPLLPAGGERAAQARMREFLAKRAARYADSRNRMDLDTTSRLSADLKFGTLSVRTLWHHARAALEAAPEAWKVYSNELLWREFTHATLWARPELLQTPFRRDFAGFPWKTERAWVDAWKTGHTGYPVVDAAARQLLTEGFVHNRARMITASFLTKHLLAHYREGEAHYMKYLVDGDWAQNNAGWQWSAGCGCDAQPYFRVFNPVTQGEKFDPNGDYVRRYVPELRKLDSKSIHAPWDAEPLSLRAAGVTLDKDYPAPIVDHAHARERFLTTAKAFLKRTDAGVEA
jgi:deoxyribodipyrimidine photo-lyase